MGWDYSLSFQEKRDKERGRRKHSSPQKKEMMMNRIEN
jgi:hypothetical protein